jgi:hypothetical protein
MNRDVHPGSRIRILIFTHPGWSRIQGSKRHRIPDPQHWILRIWIRNAAYHRDEVRKVAEELLPEHLGHQAQQELVRLYPACNKNATVTLYFYFSVEPKSKEKLYFKLLRLLAISSANMKSHWMPFRREALVAAILTKSGNRECTSTIDRIGCNNEIVPVTSPLAFKMTNSTSGRKLPRLLPPAYYQVLSIRDLLVRIKIRTTELQIRILLFLWVAIKVSEFFCLILFEGTFTSVLKDKKS